MIRPSILALLLLTLGACATGTTLKPKGTGPRVNHKQNGLWTYSYADGTTQAKGNYNLDRQIGRWTYFYPDSKKEWEVGFASEQFDGPSQWYWPNGKPEAYGAFGGGLESGPFSYWNENGSVVKRGEFDDGLETSCWESWYDSAKPKARGMICKGQRVGLWEFWSEDGTTYSHTFPLVNGLTPHREEWDDGATRREGFLENGRPVGRWSTRHENGVRRASGRIIDGQPHGIWTLYRPDATLLASVKFDHGAPAQDFQAYDGMKSSKMSSGALRLRDLGGRFSRSDEAAGRPVAEVVSTWISEAVSPLAQDAPYEAGNAGDPPPDLLGELSRKFTLPLHAQPWTESEEANMDFLVKLYTDGAPNAAAPPGGGQYNGGPRTRGAPKPKATEGNTSLSSPWIGRRLGIATVSTRDGKALDLHSLEGKPLVLVVLRGMAGEICIYCYTQVQALWNSMPEFNAAGANVVVVYPGDAERLEVFWKELAKMEKFERKEERFTFAYDSEFALVNMLTLQGNLALPATFVIDAGGTIRFAYVGVDKADRPDAKRVLEQVNGLKHP